MKVYRIERDDQRGPYTSYFGDWHTREHDNNRDTPVPHRDGLGKEFEPSEIFGFKSLLQLNNWFKCPIELANLHSIGFFVALYDVKKEHVRKGKKQLVFEGSEANMVKTISLDKLAKKFTVSKRSSFFKNLAQAKSNAPFTLEGEKLVALEQARQVGTDFASAVVLAEIVGQAEYFAKHGEFPVDQVKFIIDYLNTKGFKVSK